MTTPELVYEEEGRLHYCLSELESTVKVSWLVGENCQPKLVKQLKCEISSKSIYNIAIKRGEKMEFSLI